MPRYSEEHKAAVLKKLLPPQNRSVVQVAAEEGLCRVIVMLETMGLLKPSWPS
jgi:hypothetical protein